MAERSSRLFAVACKGCQQTLVTVERIRDSEIAILESHLRACGPSEPLGEAPMLDEIMRRVRVATLKV